MYYYRPDGTSYHLDPSCQGMKNAQPVSEADAIAAGKEPEVPAKYYLGPELYEELENLQENPFPYDGKDFCVALSPNPKKG